MITTASERLIIIVRYKEKKNCTAILDKKKTNENDENLHAC